MKQVRTRDFIYSTDGLFFASTNYVHPDDRFISFLRYIPDPNGDREKEGKRYRKVTSDEAYSYLRENHPDYLYFCDVTNVEMMGVPKDKVAKIIKPEERLAELRDAFNKGEELKNPEIMAKLMDVSDFFHYVADIPYENLGISGSILPGLHKEDVSDIDFVNGDVSCNSRTYHFTECKREPELSGWCRFSVGRGLGYKCIFCICDGGTDRASVL